MARIYALYKGEEMLMMGTKKEIAEFLGVKLSTVTFYISSANKKRDKGNKKVVVYIGNE